MEVTPSRHRLPASIRSVRHIVKTVGCGLPAAALRDPAVAAWVCARVTWCGGGAVVGQARADA
ncbi:hypothetical protein C6A87_022075 [Mycobacterium sp. ITM-2016-00317]|uniref:hypothetical protein n=1 Tax=Mycobacterium sp. ITM-2016-00317 TaxID=2099694 RepID=UPI00287F723E|nr:hypothetical protein [Mycobacterium sp. ITM-2016-00317]WNG86502.1 hypothetical protein C6A87_022075 [Mycobacterium sp. ITM-2016-00317]